MVYSYWLTIKTELEQLLVLFSIWLAILVSIIFSPFLIILQYLYNNTDYPFSYYIFLIIDK